MSVTGEAAIVTGASSGIGAALAVELARRGIAVGLVGRRAELLDEVLRRCRDHAPTSERWVEDLADPSATDRIVAGATAAFGAVDVLVNNAGMPAVRPVTRLTAAEVERAMEVNFHAPVRLTLALLPSMLERGRGTIVNVSSLGGRLGILHEAAYCASKFALCGWTEALALDLWKTPIRVKLVVPGPVDTDIWDRPGTEHAVYDGDKVPAEDVALGIVEAMGSEAFEHYLPDLRDIALYKAANIDEWLRLSVEAQGG